MMTNALGEPFPPGIFLCTSALVALQFQQIVTRLLSCHVHLYLWKWKTMHYAIPKSFEDGLRVDLCAEISQVQIGRNVYGFTDVVIPKGLYPFLSTVDVLQLRLESCVLGESKCCCIVNLQSERHWERKT